MRWEQLPSSIHPQVPAAGFALSASFGPGGLDAGGHAAVAWLVIRGTVHIRACEGEFLLSAGDWIVLGSESKPQALAGSRSVLLAAGLAHESRARLLPGRGRMAHGERRQALRSWRGGGPGVMGFLEGLQHELVAGTDRCPGHSQRRRRQVLMRMQRARLCMEGQAEDGLPIAEMARRVNFSPWYFSKVFHALYGMRPRQYAAAMRLERASRLLATTALPVIEVSAACGFENPCSFARAFRARFGMTASEHRLRRGR